MTTPDAPSPDDRLRAIAVVTDSAIGHLDVDDLLEELLARVVELLQADTAAVLLLDESGGYLAARATFGIEEEVRQGVRVPLGVGFAGHVAADRRPIRLDVVDATTVWNPILWEKGIVKMLGVPLLVGPDLLGVLHVGRVADVAFTDDDEFLLELVAARISGAVQSRQLEVERAAARIVQRSLLPSRLPHCPGFEFATRYVPAEEGGVGGDWYDAFVLPSGDLWVMTGDVAGHGLEAAITLGRLRSALRAYALQGGSPSEVLALADRKFQFFDPGKMATVVCALFPPPYDRSRMATAGHPPPVLAVPEGQAQLVEVSTGPPLGVTRYEPELAEFDLPQGALLLFFTDGLIERRDESIDVGLAQLASVVTADTPELVCRRVMAALIGGAKPTDDIAVMALRRTP
ncbi:MAG TPA: GAF domain-containing SpoIIE family protein phosphatase [Acidimicrobiales bacterium]|nr:GAF domain-containing SpoIIE family protein phosphatase [Acidimicrobiales bacterium]